MKNLCLATCLFFGIIAMTSCGPAVITERMNPPVYSRPIAPGADYVWIDGDWIYTGGNYHWREGYWSRGRSKHWEGGSWSHRRNGWYWRRGHWR